MISRLAEVLGRDVSRETTERLDAYERLLRDEASRQNLISASTLDHLFDRHILDSAQLVRFAPNPTASWVDIGSGAGLPGIVIAALSAGPVVLIEPRRLRAEFLQRCVVALDFGSRVTIATAKVENVTGTFHVLTARAVANLNRLLGISTHLSTTKSLWVLPKGRSAQSELAEAQRNWHCDATSHPSCTDPESEILVLRNVRARGGR